MPEFDYLKGAQRRSSATVSLARQLSVCRWACNFDSFVVVVVVTKRNSAYVTKAAQYRGRVRRLAMLCSLELCCVVSCRFVLSSVVFVCWFVFSCCQSISQSASQAGKQLALSSGCFEALWLKLLDGAHLQNRLDLTRALERGTHVLAKAIFCFIELTWPKGGACKWSCSCTSYETCCVWETPFIFACNCYYCCCGLQSVCNICIEILSDKPHSHKLLSLYWIISSCRPVAQQANRFS